MLKSKTEKFVDVQDFDNLVTETYGKSYCFQQQNGCQERGVYYLTVPNLNAEDFEDDEIPEVINGQDMGVSFTSWLKHDFWTCSGNVIFIHQLKYLRMICTVRV